MPYLYLVFGTHKVLAETVKDSRDGSGCTLTFTAEAPDIMVTGCQGPNVPLTLLIEAANGDEVSRTAASTFAYHDASLAGAGANPDEITRKLNNTAGLRFNYKCLQLRNCTSPAISVAV
ncbi:hypothetical protein HYQ46_009039 [Verticillium longisporum]|nr:hypothetical protein HYQ46_009039 [Verticillium longisporum]